MSEPATTLHGRIADVAVQLPGAPALLIEDRTITFAELLARSTAAAGLVAQHTSPGDRVAFVAWNGPWWVEAAIGVPMAGRVLAMISPRLTAPEVEAMLDAVDASLVVVDAAAGAGDLDHLADTGRVVIGLDAWNALVGDERPSLPSPSVAHSPERPAWLVFTSGTTAAPKAAIVTHRSLLAAVAATAAARPDVPDDVYLFPFPQWHIAIYNVFRRLLAGRPVVLHGRFDPAGIVRDIARHGVTSMSVAATMLDAILDEAAADPAGRAALASLRDISYGAAPMPATVLRRAAAALDVRFWQGYGMTELSGNAVFLGADDHVRGLTDEAHLLRAAGRAAPGVEVRITDDGDRPVHTGTVGEIQVRAAQVVAGYWNDEAATAAALTSDGWLRTGDIGQLDSTGLLRVLDRKKDVIITGGENVSAREVEEVLRGHPDVADVAVVGVADPRWGENVCAVVVPANGTVDGDGLRAFARTQLAGFKVPRHVVVRDRLPVNASGKVVKAELRAWLAEHIEALDTRH